MQNRKQRAHPLARSRAATAQDEQLNYSEFLAATLQGQLRAREAAIRATCAFQSSLIYFSGGPGAFHLCVGWLQQLSYCHFCPRGT